MWILGLSLVVALVSLFVFDLVRPSRAPSVGMLVSRAWLHLPLLALLSLALFVGSTIVRRRSPWPSIAKGLRRAALGLGLLVAVPVHMMMVEACVYEPIKFSYLIYRVESASTVQEERAAFLLAGKWGRVWELNRVEKREHLPPRARHLQGDWILEVEWLESWPAGSPYRAYRRVLDEQNMKVIGEDR